MAKKNNDLRILVDLQVFNHPEYKKAVFVMPSLYICMPH